MCTHLQTPLAALATRPGEKCGLIVMVIAEVDIVAPVIRAARRIGVAVDLDGHGVVVTGVADVVSEPQAGILWSVAAVVDDQVVPHQCHGATKRIDALMEVVLDSVVLNQLMPVSRDDTDVILVNGR